MRNLVSILIPASAAATNPDHLFDSLDSGTRDKTELHALLATDSPATGGPDYRLKRCLAPGLLPTRRADSRALAIARA